MLDDKAALGPPSNMSSTAKQLGLVVAPLI